MTKTILTTSLLFSVFMTGCVSAGRYNDLEAEHVRTKEALAVSEASVSDLSKKLGISDTQRNELEGNVNEMKTAMEELQKRRKETERRLAEFSELTAKFSELVNAGKLSVRVVNGRMTVALSTDILFPSGSAKLSPAGETSVREVTKLLASLKGRKYQIEGHTDNVPIKSSQYPSNWELASARGMTVLKMMLESGMPADRISGASYADTQPVGANNSPEGRSQNRRIAIAIVPDLSGLPGHDELNRLMSSSDSGSKKKRAADKAAD